MFERFSDDARRTVVYAEEESRLLGHRHIGTEHLLLGLLHDDPLGRQTVRILNEAGVHPNAVRQHLQQQAEDAAGELVGHIPFTPHAQHTLQQAAVLRERLGQARLTRAHLLVALLTITDARGVQILRALGTDLAHLTATAERVAASSGADEPTGPPATATAAIRVTDSDRPTAAATDLPRHVHRLIRERHRLAVALRRYGRHDDDCDPDQGCTCGLGPILDEAERD